MGFLDKISDKITEQIEERLGTEKQYERPMTQTERIESYSKENYEKHHVEIDEHNQRMEQIFKTDSYPERFNDVLDCCSKILELDPYNFNAKINAITAMSRNGKPKPAINTCKSLLKLYPNNPMLENLMGEIYWYSEDYGSAILFFNSVIQRTPYTDHEALKAKQGKGESLYMCGRYDEAIEFCNDQLLLHENDEELIDVKMKSLEKIQELNEQTQKANEQTQKANDAPDQPTSDSSQNQNNTSDVSIPDQISKFAKLKEQGLISDEEFNEMKQKLMKKI